MTVNHQEYSLTRMTPPSTEWIATHAVIPDLLCPWPAKLFSEGVDVASGEPDMRIDDQVLIVSGCYKDTADGDGEQTLEQAALLIPMSVAAQLARMILRLCGET